MQGEARLMAALEDLARLLVKVTPVKERDSASRFPEPLRLETGTVTAVGAASATVQFASSVDLPTSPIPGIGYLQRPAVGDVVVAAVQGPARLILGSVGEQGAWTSYTPTLKFGATAITVGNGTLSGLYTQHGKLVHVEVGFAWGTTSSKNAGSGDLSFTLPIGAAAAGAGTNVGSAIGTVELLQSGVARTARTVIIDADTAGLGRCYFGDMGFGQWVVSDTVPFTFAQTNNGFMANMSYRIA